MGDTARGLLMPSLRLMPLLRLDTAADTARGRLRLSPATAMAATDADMAAMAATGVVVTDTARGLLMPSLRLMPLPRLVTAAAMVVMAAATAAMAATDTAVDTARGRLRLSPATAMDADMAA